MVHEQTVQDGKISVEEDPQIVDVESEQQDTESSSAGEDDDTPRSRVTMTCFRNVLLTYQFPLMIIGAIGAAKAYPKLGAVYLKPEITATWIAVVIIFLISGIGLRTNEFSHAFKRLRYNIFLQVFNFGVTSGIVYSFSRFLKASNILNDALADGMVICASLPMAINIVIVLSASTQADEASAVFNSTFGNILGIFLSPLLILGYLGTSGDISLGEVFLKLTLRVVVPLIFGQVVQKMFASVRKAFQTHKKKVKKVQELCLVFIVYTVFSRTFYSSNGAGATEVFIMILFQFILLISLMILAWYSLKVLFTDQPERRVTGLFACCMKTVALGIPLINSMYGNSENEALYTLPILIWHPMQLVIGSLLVPRLTKFIESENKRLGKGKETPVRDRELPEKNCEEV